MTNPLSSYGYSDEDYETAIGMMVGESHHRSTGQTLLHEMAGQLDVALNRQGSHLTGGRTFGKGAGPSLTNVILSPSQFDAATKTKGRAHKEQYSPAKRAALDDEYLATLPPAMQARVQAAREAALKVAGTKELRGITKNATTTSSTGYKLSAARAREHNKEGRKTATKIGGTSFYGKGHDRKRSQEQAAAISTKLDQRASTSAPRADTPKERNLSGMTASRGTPAAAAPDVSMGRFYDAPATPAAAPYSQYGEFGTPREAIPPEARAPYSPSSLDPAPASVPDWGLGDIGFGPDPEAPKTGPVDYGKTYPEISAGLYPDIAPPDVPAVPDIMSQFDRPNLMTEQQAIENVGLEGQRLSENVERRQADFGRSIDEQVKDRWVAEETNDYLSAVYGGILGPQGVGMNVGINPASPAFTTNPYEDLAPPQQYGPDVPRTYPDISAGIYGENPRSVFDAAYGGYTPNIGQLTPEAVLDAIRNAPTTPAAPMSNKDFNAAFEGFPVDDSTGSLANAQMSISALGGPGYAAGTTAQLGTPDFSAASAVDRDIAYQAEMAAQQQAYRDARDPAATQARGAWSDQIGTARAMDAQPTNFQGGLYGDPAMPAGSFAPGLDFSQALGPSPDRFSGGAAPNPFSPDASAFNERMSDLLQPGPAPPAELSAFQNTPLGLGQGFIDQGPYSSPISGLGKSFSPANLGNPMPNSTAVATQAPAAPQIIGYEPGKAITRDVPNPAWSEWSKDYATKNAAQEAWLNADEDKFGWDRAPPNPSVLADTRWAGLKDEPPKTIQETKIAAATPIYSKPEVAAAVRAAPVASVPAVRAQPVAAQPVAAQPLARTVSAPVGVGVGGWWDSITTGIGNALSGMSLSGLGGGNYGGYGGFGGGYDPGGYGGGGYGGALGDAGYGSDARSGAGNMGAGNLYQ